MLLRVLLATKQRIVGSVEIRSSNSCDSKRSKGLERSPNASVRRGEDGGNLKRFSDTIADDHRGVYFEWFDRRGGAPGIDRTKIEQSK